MNFVHTSGSFDYLPEGATQRFWPITLKAEILEEDEDELEDDDEEFEDEEDDEFEDDELDEEDLEDED